MYWQYILRLFPETQQRLIKTPTQKMGILWHPNMPKVIRGLRSIVQYVQYTSTPLFGIDLKTNKPWPNLTNTSICSSKKSREYFLFLKKFKGIVKMSHTKVDFIWCHNVPTSMRHIWFIPEKLVPLQYFWSHSTQRILDQD